MEALCSSETLVPNHKSARRYNPEGDHIHLHFIRRKCENLRINLNFLENKLAVIVILDERYWRK
jgi:hypothetical protein